MSPTLSITGLSGNEIFCMCLKGFVPSGIVVGNSVRSMGFLGDAGAAGTLAPTFIGDIAEHCHWSRGGKDSIAA